MNDTFTHGIFTFKLRPAEETDLAYILDTWLEGMAGEYRDVRKSDYEHEARRSILDILQRLTTVVVIASPVDAPSVIWAYLVAEPDALHWLYVRRTHRRLGIARRLFKSVTGDAPGPHVVTHMTASARKIKSRYRNLFRYLPWRAHQQPGEPDDSDTASGPTAQDPPH